MINQYGNIYSDLQKSFIKKIKKKLYIFKIRGLIDYFKKIKVLVIGETILDQYIFCEGLGKSGKESVLSFKRY